MERENNHGQLNEHFLEGDNGILGGFPARVGHSDGDDGFDLVLRYLREPFDPTDPDAFDQRAASLQQLHNDLRGQMEELEQKQTELARMHADAGDDDDDDDDDDDGYDDEYGDDNYDDEGIEYGDLYEHAGQDEDEDEMEAEYEEEPVRERERRRRPPKPRRPYTITCAQRQTNWFESSLQWENEHFRAVYRLVIYETLCRVVLTLVASVYQSKPFGALFTSCSRILGFNLRAANHSVRYITNSLYSSCDTALQGRMSVIQCC
jgi:hypothetical protein